MAEPVTDATPGVGPDIMTPPDDHRDTCAIHDLLMAKLDHFEGKMDKFCEAVGRRLNHGDIQLTGLGDRLRRLELLVYSGVGFVLLSVLGALVALVVRMRP